MPLLIKVIRMENNRVQLPGSDACLRRIGCEDYALCFLKGEIWMPPLSRYRAMGDTADGIGDVLEGIRLVQNGRSLQALSSTAANEAVILSTTALVNQALGRIAEHRGKAQFRMKDDFADFSTRCSPNKDNSFGVIFSASDLVDRFKEYANAKGLVFAANLVRYTANVLNTEQYKRICSDGSIFDETLFRKRSQFSDQYEYRFVLVPKQSDIDAGIKLPLNERGFYVAHVEPFACMGIQMCMQDD